MAARTQSEIKGNKICPALKRIFLWSACVPGCVCVCDRVCELVCVCARVKILAETS